MEEILKTSNHYNKLTIVTLTTVIGLIIINILSFYFTKKEQNQLQKRIYVVNKNKEFEALATSIEENRPAEINFHIKRFHELFFSVYPDAEGIEANLNKALFLSDESGKRLYDDLKEQNFYQDMIQGNIIEKIKIDSVQLNAEVYPFQAKTFATIEQIRSTARTERQMVTSCELHEIARSINCPNGLLIRKFKVLQAEIVK